MVDPGFRQGGNVFGEVWSYNKRWGEWSLENLLASGM